MTRIRRSAAAAPLGAVIIALVVAGCGSSAASQAADPEGQGNQTSQAPASVDAGGGNGGNGGNGGSEDAQAVGEQLIPPNSTEVGRTTAPGYWYVIYESSDSPDSLKGYYENKIPSVGLMIVSTSSAEGSHSLLVSRDDAGTFGGAVGLSPSQDGSGSTVTISIGG